MECELDPPTWTLSERHLRPEGTWLVAGLGHLAGVKVPVFAILFIIIGASIILRPLFAKRPN